jgi:hypothetical protein
MDAAITSQTSSRISQPLRRELQRPSPREVSVAFLLLGGAATATAVGRGHFPVHGVIGVAAAVVIAAFLAALNQISHQKQ